jgi:hypothetical protein
MTSTGDTPEPNELHRADDRTDILLVEDGIVVYDVENPDAWIKSDESVPRVERR